MNERPTAEQLRERVTAQAVEVLKLAPDDREERFAALRQTNYAAALADGMTGGEARDMTEQMEAWVREAVRLIEAGQDGDRSANSRRAIAPKPAARGSGE